MKQKSVMAIILTLIMSMAVFQFTNVSFANFFPEPGLDLPRIYIKSDGSVEPATAPIERTGNLYKLKENITMKTIVIQRDNIVLDGAYHLIEGNKSWMGLAPYFGDAGNNGIIITGRKNINITNLNIERFTTGIRIYNSSYINIFGNSFKEETAVFDTPAGLLSEASSYILIENNTFTSINGPAIVCDGVNITIRGNTLIGIFDSIHGSIALKGSSNTITDNKIETVFPSIRLTEANANIIARNHVKGGISLVSSSNNIIFRNNLTNIRLIFSSNNSIHGNYMASNIGLDTIELDQGTANNTFYGNSFPANCSVRVNDAGINFWDNGTMGNYWADYDGTDSNGDGIGDYPYIIFGVKWNNTVGGDVSFIAGYDNFPLMGPYNVEHDAVILPQTAPYLPFAAGAVAIVLVISAGFLFYFKKHKH